MPAAGPGVMCLTTCQCDFVRGSCLSLSGGYTPTSEGVVGGYSDFKFGASRSSLVSFTWQVTVTVVVQVRTT
jgi:hypothetical protein